MIFAIKPFEIHDGDGIRTTVFLKGCPLRCKWCHNPESFSPKKEILYDPSLCKNCMKCVSICDANQALEGKHVFDRTACTACGKCKNVCPHEALEPIGYDAAPGELVTELLRDKMFMIGSGGGVTLSGGEPLMQIDYCTELAKRLKQEGINVAIDTSLFVSREALDQIIPYVDTFLIDIKAIDEQTHLHCTGVSNRMILDNIRYLDRLGIPMEIRYPYIPTYNDKEAPAIAKFLKSLHTVKRVRVLAYHNYAERKYECLGMQYPLGDLPLPCEEELLAVRTLIGAEQD